MFLLFFVGIQFAWEEKGILNSENVLMRIVSFKSNRCFNLKNMLLSGAENDLLSPNEFLSQQSKLFLIRVRKG